MKVLDLQCAHGHGFEGWFASSEAFEAQLGQGLVACPVCNDCAITKLLSAPRLNLGAGRGLAPAAAGSEAALSHSAPPTPEVRWMLAVRELMARTE
ncbi:MAG: DUF1178 family protein, partial [Comamonadaceae bacterium]